MKRDMKMKKRNRKVDIEVEAKGKREARYPIGRSSRQFHKKTQIAICV